MTAIDMENGPVPESPPEPPELMGETARSVSAVQVPGTGEKLDAILKALGIDPATLEVRK